MTRFEEARTRPGFDVLELDISADEAHRRINEAVQGLSASEIESGMKYRATDGTLVAIVGARSAGDDEEAATLVYRTAPASEPATRKASKVSSALESHAVDP